MSRALAALLAVSTLAGCTTVPDSSPAAWADCARTEAVALIARGIAPSSPQVAELPADGPMQSIDLGPDPPDAIHDAFMHTLHLIPNRNVFYVRQTGGFAGVTSIYGPYSLRGRCRAPAPGAP